MNTTRRSLLGGVLAASMSGARAQARPPVRIGWLRLQADEVIKCAGVLADRILRGADPAEIPFEQSTKFEFVLNLKAARALGIAVPPSLRLQADEVIE